MAVLTLMLSAQPTDKLLHVFQVYIVESQGTMPGTELVFRFSGIFLGGFFCFAAKCNNDHSMGITALIELFKS